MWLVSIELNFTAMGNACITSLLVHRREVIYILYKRHTKLMSRNWFWMAVIVIDLPSYYNSSKLMALNFWIDQIKFLSLFLVNIHMYNITIKHIGICTKHQPICIIFVRSSCSDVNHREITMGFSIIFC